MCMANTISSSQKPLLRVTIARFDNPPPCLKSFSKVFPESRDPFGLDSYSDFLFQPWANPIHCCEANCNTPKLSLLPLVFINVSTHPQLTYQKCNYSY